MSVLNVMKTSCLPATTVEQGLEEQFSVAAQAKGLLELDQAIPNGLNFEAVKTLALECAEEVLAHWLADGLFEGNEYVATNPTRADHEPGSFKINVQTGLWSDFAIGDSGGDLISLVAYVEGIAQRRAAIKILNYISSPEFGAESALRQHARSRAKKRGSATSVVETIMPIPASAPQRPTIIKDLGSPVASWIYQNADGEAMLYVHRFQNSAGEKTMRPQTYCAHVDGHCSWEWKAPIGPRPAYGLEKLAIRPLAPVLFTEGEKAADAAQRLFPDFVTVTTMGGSNAPDKTDFTPFAGKAVYIAPDNDVAGVSYASKLRDLLTTYKAQVVGTLNLQVFKPNDGELAEGFDVADAEAEGWNAERIEALGSSIWEAVTTDEISTQPGNDQGEVLIRGQVETTLETSPSKKKKEKPTLMEQVKLFVNWRFKGALAFAQNQFRSYTDGYWPVLDQKVDIDRKLCEFLGPLAVPGLIGSMSSLMSSAYAVGNDAFSEAKALVCLLNGTLEPIKGTVREHRKEDYLTNRLEVNWSDDAICPLWLQTLDEIFAPDTDKAEKIQLMQEFIGYCLVPMTHMHKFLWLVGSGGNGKSLVLSVLTALVGKANISFAQIERIQEKFVRAELCGKLVNISSEMSAQATVADGYLKQIVGGDVVEAERKHQPSFAFKPYCRMIGATNELPRLLDGSDGFFRRAIIVRFNRRFTEAEQDRSREARLMNELSGILRWAVIGLQRLLDRGSFVIPASSIEEANRYRVYSDPIRQFVDECIVASESRFDYLTPVTLHEHYQEWSRAYGYQAVGVNKLTTKLKDLGFMQSRAGGTRFWHIKYTAPATAYFGQPEPEEKRTSPLAAKYST